MNFIQREEIPEKEREYRLVELSSGQQAPDGSTGVGLGDGIVWVGRKGAFPSKATGDPNDPNCEFAATYINRLMSKKEIREYKRGLAGNNTFLGLPYWKRFVIGSGIAGTIIAAISVIIVV